MELFSPVVVDLIVAKPPNLLSSELFLLTPAISAVKAELDQERKGFFSALMTSGSFTMMQAGSFLLQTSDSDSEEGK